MSGKHSIVIRSLRCILLSAPYAEPGDAERELHLRTGLRSAAFVLVQSTAGASGVGEAYAGAYAPEVVRAIVEQVALSLNGKEVDSISGLMASVQHQVRYWGRAGVTQGALGAIEAALLDLEGKLCGQPVYEILGGRRHTTLPVYASGGNDKPYQELEAEICGYVQVGFGAVKIRINNLPAHKAIEKVRVCSQALDGKAALAVDAVQSNTRFPWTVDEAARMVESLAPLGLLWLEEPLPPENVEGLARLRGMGAMPIAGGETITTLDEVERLLEHGAIDILQPDAAVMGVGRFLKASQLCANAGVNVAVHAWCGAPGHLANYHAAFATPNCMIVERGAVRNPLRDEFMGSACSMRQGRLSLSDAPGLGGALPENFEQLYPYQPNTHYRFDVGS
jgi:L-alanine-DL-glutamate epimerase-like enolase superfamily enzyme